MQDDIKNAILKKSIGITPEEREQIHYDNGTNIANEQQKIYIFHQSTEKVQKKHRESTEKMQIYGGIK